MKAIEGEPNGLPVIFVDDILNSAETFAQGYEVLRFNRLEVSLVWALVDFHNPVGLERVMKTGCSLMTEYSLEELGLERSQPVAPYESFPYEWAWNFIPGEPQRSYHVIPKSTPVLDDSSVFFGAENGKFYAVDQNTGEERWSFQTGAKAGKGIYSTPLLVEDCLVFGSYDGNVYCLDRLTGAVNWKFIDADWVGSSPTLIPDTHLVVIGLEHSLSSRKGSVIALDLESGERVWECTVPAYVHGTPLYVEQAKAIFIGTNDRELLVLDSATGHIRAILSTGGEIKSAPTYDPLHEAVIFGSFDGYVYSLDLVEYRVRWSVHTENLIYSQPLVIGSKAFVASTDKSLYVIDTGNGRVTKRLSLDGKLFSSPRLVDGSVYVGSTSGRLYRIDPGTYEVRSFTQMHDRITTAVASSGKQLGNRMYVLTNDSTLSCMTAVVSSA